MPRPRLRRLEPARDFPVDGDDGLMVRATALGRDDDGELVARIELHNGRLLWGGDVALDQDRSRNAFLLRAWRVDATQSVMPNRAAIERAMLDALSAAPAILAELERDPISSNNSISSDISFDVGAFRAPKLPAFPVDALPGALGDILRESVSTMPVPPEFVGLPLLIATGAAVGNRTRLALTRSYSRRAIFWGAIVGDPGSLKSASLEIGVWGLRVLQDGAFDAWQVKVERWKRDHAEWSAKTGRDAKTRGPEPERPELEHFFTTDATVEAVAPILQHDAGVVYIRDELVGWVASFDAYKASGTKGSDRARLLEMWSGAGQKIDRKAKDALPIYIRNPHLCVAGGVQPDRLAALAEEATTNDGFVDRFLWVWPECPPLDFIVEGVDPETAVRVAALFRALRSGPVPEVVNFNPEAMELWVAWFRANARLVERRSGLRAGMYAKMDSHAARIALVLHCAANAGNPSAREMSRSTLLNALRLAECFRGHAMRVAVHFEGIGWSRKSLSAKVLAALGKPSEGANQDGWRCTDDVLSGVGRHVRAQSLHAALNSLGRRNLIESRRPSRTGAGRRGTEWRLKPDAFDGHEKSEEMELLEEIEDYTVDCIDLDALVRQLDGEEPAGEVI